MVPKSSERTKLSALVPRADVDALFRIARSHDRSVSAEVRSAIAEHVVDNASQESPTAAASFSAARLAASAERGEARAPRLAGNRPSPAAPDGSGPPGGAEAA